MKGCNAPSAGFLHETPEAELLVRRQRLSITTDDSTELIGHVSERHIWPDKSDRHIHRLESGVPISAPKEAGERERDAEQEALEVALRHGGRDSEGGGGGMSNAGPIVDQLFTTGRRVQGGMEGSPHAG